MTNEVREVLRKVRDEQLTNESRWWKRGNGNNETGTCLALAINAAAGARVSDIDVIQALGFPKFTDAIAWNDAPTTTFADVRALLDKALAKETV